MAEGQVNLGQVEVIADSLKDLSDQVGPEQRAEGEQALLDACASLDPIGLSRLGRRLEELLDAEGVQARDEPNSANTATRRTWLRRAIASTASRGADRSEPKIEEARTTPRR